MTSAGVTTIGVASALDIRSGGVVEFNEHQLQSADFNYTGINSTVYCLPDGTTVSGQQPELVQALDQTTFCVRIFFNENHAIAYA